MKCGLEVLFSQKKLHDELAGKRLAYLAHPASVSHSLIHGLDLLSQVPELKIVSAFGPQHGLRGEKQDNMIESEDFLDPRHKIPVFSLYGRVRRPTAEMLDTFDVLLYDLQDVGCRIYTFLTTLFYVMEDCAREGKSIWILDRPNPAGRPVEGNVLQAGFESFVGAAPVPMRHGLTMAEAAQWYRAFKGLDLDLRVVAMEGYDMHGGPGYGWPLLEFPWVNPSPNLSTVQSTKVYPGTVLFEGTNLSEGRGTTRALEVFGAPFIDNEKVFHEMFRIQKEWLEGGILRPCYFEPTFHKFKGELCSGFQMHTDHIFYDHETFQPYRVACLFLKVVRTLYPEFALWRLPPYEYEEEKMPIDILSGSDFLREWVEDSESEPEDLNDYLLQDETIWREQVARFLIY